MRSAREKWDGQVQATASEGAREWRSAARVPAPARYWCGGSSEAVGLARIPPKSTSAHGVADIDASKVALAPVPAFPVNKKDARATAWHRDIR
jgi:hypothetical protein